MNTQKIYISGSISGRDIKVARAHFYAAYLKLIPKWGEVLNPFEIGTKSSFTWVENMRICIREMMKCQAIYMLKGWGKSKGAWTELLIAKVLKFQIIFEK